MKTTLLALTAVAVHCTTHAQYKIDSTFNINGTNEYMGAPGNVVNGEKLAYTTNNDIIVAGRFSDYLTVWKYNQTGILDASFSGGMSAFVMPTGVSTWVRDLEVLPDGKILVLAEAELGASGSMFPYSQASIVLARFLPNGMPDPSFDTDGLVNMDLMPAFEYHPICLAVDTITNGIFVGGWGVEYGSYDCPVGTGCWFIAKYQDNGALDPSFHSTGYIQSTSSALAQTYTTITPQATVLDLKPQQGGDLLAAGAFNARDSSYFSLRLKANGDYDSAYAFNGVSLTFIDTYPIPPAGPTYAKILGDNSIIYNSEYVTYGTAGGPDSTDLYIYKKDDAGNTETSFGTGGFVTLHQTSLRNRLAIDNEDRLIYTWYNRLPVGSQTVYFRRLLPNGTIDYGFGVGGILKSEPIPGDPYMNGCTMNDIQFNKANDDISLVAFRSASYVPATFRVLNYSLDPDFVTAVSSVQKEDNAIAVYPNPNAGVFTIETGEVSAYKIYTGTGTVIQNGKLNPGKNTIDLSALSKGIYFVEVADQQGNTRNRKIMVE